MKRILIELLILTGVLIFLTICLITGSNIYDKQAEKCNKAYGYKCSYYQVISFENGKR